MAGVSTSTTGIDTWREVIALLVEAAERGYRDSATDPGLHSVALAADILASAAINVLPEALDDLLDEVVLRPGTEALDAGSLIRVAEEATRRLPIEQLPLGASWVVVAICDLARQTSP